MENPEEASRRHNFAILILPKVEWLYQLGVNGQGDSDVAVAPLRGVTSSSVNRLTISQRLSARQSLSMCFGASWGGW